VAPSPRTAGPFFSLQLIGDVADNSNEDGGLVREYVKASPLMWSGSTGKALRGDPAAQALYCYLIICPHSNMIGLFRLPMAYILADLGMKQIAFTRSLERLQDLGFLQHDKAHDFIWIVDAFRHEMGGKPIVREDNRWVTVMRQIAEHSLSSLAEDFCAHYHIDPAEVELRGRWKKDPINRQVREEVKERDKSACRYCGVVVDWQDRRGRNGGTYDHVNPLLPGISSNVVVACRQCNSVKGHRTPEEAQMDLRSNHGSDSDQPQIVSASDLKPVSGSGSGSGTGADGERSVGPAARRAARRAELDWRIAETWATHLKAREAFWMDRNGRPAEAPSLTPETRGAIRDQIEAHDSTRLAAEDRDRWTRESPVRAAGVGLFLSKWHTGEDSRNNAKTDGSRYLEPWRPWKHQKGKPDPVPTFSQLYFEDRNARRR
jgi:hypothetical protein